MVISKDLFVIFVTGEKIMDNKEYEDYQKELDYLRSERLEELDQLLKEGGNTPLLEAANNLINKGYKGE